MSIRRRMVAISTAASLAFGTGLVITTSAEALGEPTVTGVQTPAPGVALEHCYRGPTQPPQWPKLRSCRVVEEEHYGKGKLPFPDSHYDDPPRYDNKPHKPGK